MSEYKIQEDLFGGGAPSSKPPKTPVLGGYAKQRYLPYIKMPTEVAVMAVISILILLIVSYAVGVKVGIEQGPRDAGTVVFEDEMERVSEVTPPDVTVTPVMLKDVMPGPEKVVPSPHGEQPVLPLTGKAELEEKIVFSEKLDIPEKESGAKASVDELPEEGRYVIYLAAFRQEARADEAAEQLRLEGVDARVKKRSDWYQVYTAGYRDIDEARSARDILRQNYEDCYIRRLD